ncbi:MAG: hypothetical protein AAB403_03730 [Planctomycetota bacterium]
MKLIVGTVDQYLDIDSGQTLLRVPYQIVDENGVQLTERIQSFPLGATLSEVETALQQALQVYRDDVVRYEEAQVFQAQLDSASQVGEDISGLEIN